MKHKLITAVCAVAPGGFVALAALAVFSPTFRKEAVETIKSIKKRLD